jgi:hypothetical protein
MDIEQKDTQEQAPQEQKTPDVQAEVQGAAQPHYAGDAYRRVEEPLKTYVYDSHALAALVLGIIAVIMPMQAFGLGSLVGLALGIIALFQAKASLVYTLNPMARTGKVLAIIAIVLSVLSLIALTVFMVGIGNMGSYMHNTVRFSPRFIQMQRFW